MIPAKTPAGIIELDTHLHDELLPEAVVDALCCSFLQIELAAGVETSALVVKTTAVEIRST